MKGEIFLNFLRRIQDTFHTIFSRSESLRDPDHWFTELQKYRGTMSTEQALKVSAVYGCNKVLSETIGTLPLKCYERTQSGETEEYGSYPLARLMRAPNILQTRAEFFETLVTHINMRGNHYCGINYEKGYPQSLILLNPTNMLPEIKNNRLFYFYSPGTTGELMPLSSGWQQQYLPWQIFHNKNLTIDGLNGLTPISFARKSIDLSLESENHGYTYFKNGARASGFLKHPGQISPKAAENLKKSMEKKVTGDNKFRIALLEEGIEYQSASMSNEDAQYLQTRQFQVEDVARWYRVPLELLGHPSKTSSYASVEQFMLSFVIHTIRPWLVKIEQRINSTLVPEEDRERVYFEFLVDGLLRGDILTRYKAYSIGRQWGWFSADDVLRKENMNPLPNTAGKKYMMPLNMEDVENPRKKNDQKK